MARVLDYSAGIPGAAAIKRAGYAGAVRYIGFPDRTKCTNRDELRDFTTRALGMALVYEDNADDWRGGFARGRDAGRRARDHAGAIGFPAGRPIYMAVDRDVVTAAEFNTMVEYLRGAAQVLGGVNLTGVYGEHDVMVRAQQAGVAKWFWQTRAWSGTPVRLYPGRHLYQHPGRVRVGGIDCDFNDVLKADWGQHTQEDEMNEQQYKVLVETQRRVSNTYAVAVENQRRITAGNAAIAALSGLLANGANGLTADQVTTAVETGVTKALADNTVDNGVAGGN
jgi:hypothetical protein